MLYEVLRSDRSGYIDASGRVIVPIDADSSLEFGDGRGGVYRGRKLEIVNEKGALLGSCSGVYATGPFSEGRMDVVDRDNLAENPELRAGYIDQSGHWIIPPKFRQASKFSEDVAVASVSYGSMKHLVGLIDLKGNWVDEPRFESILGFGRSMAVTIARQSHGPKGNVRCFLIDKLGQHVGQSYFEDGRGGSDGLVPVKQKGKFGCVDERGQVAIPFSFEDINYFSEGLAAARVSDEKVGAIDKSGHWAVQPIFVDIGNFSGGLAPAQINESGVYKWGYIDRSGSWVINPKFEEAYDFVEGVAEVIPLGLDPDDIEQMGYIKTNGDYIWEPSTM